MKKKIYFCGSIRGAAGNEDMYRLLVDHMERTDTVLTRHIAYRESSVLENAENMDSEIYSRDTAWLRECDIVIAECTSPSLGVGYELAYAERLGKPAYILYNPKECRLSAMLAGDEYFRIYEYEMPEEAVDILDRILAQH